MVRQDRLSKTDVRIRLESERQLIMKSLRLFVMMKGGCQKQKMEAISIYFKFKEDGNQRTGDTPWHAAGRRG